MRIPRPLQVGALGLTLSFWLLCVATPLMALLARQSASPWQGLFDPAVRGALGFTLWQAGWSTVISALIGFGWGLKSAGSRGARFFLGLPFGIPTVVLSWVFVAWLGRSGIFSATGLAIDWLYRPGTVVAAHVWLNAPWVAMLMAQAREQVEPRQLEAVRSLGGGAWARFRFVLWPALRWTWASACLQVFSLCVMSFAIVLLLGGGPPAQTLETAIYSRVRSGIMDLEGAQAFAIWELGLCLLPWIFLVLLQRLKPSMGGANVVEGLLRTPLGNAHAQAKSVWPVLLSLLPLLPFLVLLKSRFWTLARSVERGAEVSDALFTSLRIAGLTGFMTLAIALGSVLALASLRKSRWQSVLFLMLQLPSGVSALVLGLGFWLAYGRWIDPFEGSLLAIIAIQIVLFFPLALRILWPVALSSQRGLLETASTLGASPARAFYWAEWPRWKRPVFAALALVLGASVGEVAAVSLFYSEALVPLPLVVARWMGQYRFEEAEMAAAVLFLVAVGLTGAGLASGRVRKKK